MTIDHFPYVGTLFGTIRVNINAIRDSTTPKTDARWNPLRTTSGERDDEAAPPPDRENMNA